MKFAKATKFHRKSGLGPTRRIALPKPVEECRRQPTLFGVAANPGGFHSCDAREVRGTQVKARRKTTERRLTVDEGHR